MGLVGLVYFRGGGGGGCCFVCFVFVFFNQIFVYLALLGFICCLLILNWCLVKKISYSLSIK